MVTWSLSASLFDTSPPPSARSQNQELSPRTWSVSPTRRQSQANQAWWTSLSSRVLTRPYSRPARPSAVPPAPSHRHVSVCLSAAAVYGVAGCFYYLRLIPVRQDYFLVKPTVGIRLRFSMDHVMRVGIDAQNFYFLQFTPFSSDLSTVSRIINNTWSVDALTNHMM